ncbi:MAG: hypothetical protein KOO60_08420 [Gemmatimonadales bacterium]|nr:hypothetical protein [Gemmatimonadales bacterium]
MWFYGVRFPGTILILAAGASSVPSIVSAMAEAISDTTKSPPAPEWSFRDSERARWNLAVTTGFDAFVHTFPLATADTTETIAEYLAQVGIEGHSVRSGRHRWSLRAESSVGTQLFRERIEAGYRLVDHRRRTRLRLDGSLWGRQYRRDTEYSLSSDNLEGRLDLRAYPLVRSGMGLEARGWNTFQEYDKPSTLETDHREWGVGTFLRSRGLGSHLWNMGSRWTARSYPDSAQIDRVTTGLEGGYEYLGSSEASLRLYHRSDRRRIEDETVRPSAWIHWSDLVAAVPAGAGRVLCELESEVWRYDQEMSAYFDSWRMRGFGGFGWGEILSTRWRLGLAGERLEAGNSPETYSQFGLRTGVEAFARDVSGSLTLELGRRLYDFIEVTENVNPASDSTGAAGSDYVFSYSDFTYWEIWLMGAWSISDHFSLDVLANYQPERHTEAVDDSALGFGSIRLVWRP